MEKDGERILGATYRGRARTGRPLTISAHERRAHTGRRGLRWLRPRLSAIHWSPEARDSLREIVHWVRDRAGASASARLVRRIRARTRALKTMPRPGRVVPEYEVESLREIVVAHIASSIGWVRTASKSSSFCMVGGSCPSRSPNGADSATPRARQPRRRLPCGALPRRRWR